MIHVTALKRLFEHHTVIVEEFKGETQHGEPVLNYRVKSVMHGLVIASYRSRQCFTPVSKIAGLPDEEDPQDIIGSIYRQWFVDFEVRQRAMAADLVQQLIT